MTPDQIDEIRNRLLREHPGAHIVMTPDRAEIVAEIAAGRAVAVIERSVPHFHCKMTETYRVQEGTLHVACGGRGHVLRPGDSLTIEPGLVHHACGVGGPAWLEVLSDPAWTDEDHHVL